MEHLFDCIVFATGFEVSKTGSPIPIFGRDGRSLDDEWSDGIYGYRSVTVSGYSNLFLTFGPNSGPGHTSALIYVEAQISYIVRMVTKVLEEDLHSVEVDADVQARHNVELQRRLAGTTWNSGCQGWYLTDDGFNGTMWPGFATQYERQLEHLRMQDYHVKANPLIETSAPDLIDDVPRAVLAALVAIDGADHG